LYFDVANVFELNLLSDLSAYYPMDSTGNVLWDGTDQKLDKKQSLQEYVEKMQVVYHSDIEVTSGFRNDETDEIIQNTNPEQVVDHVLCPSTYRKGLL
jgi:hypothetical protein